MTLSGSAPPYFPGSIGAAIVVDRETRKPSRPGSARRDDGDSWTWRVPK